MKKLEKIKEYFIKNNITCFLVVESTSKNGKIRLSCHFYTNLYDSTAFNKKFIVCLKNENTSYLIDFLKPNSHYQKLGDFNKGIEITNDIELYYRSDKYANFPTTFLDPQKQTSENIEKYEKFWENKFYEYPEYSGYIINRIDNNQIKRKLKLKKIK